MLFMGVTLVNGTGKICVSDIGHGSDDPTEAGDALACVTDNTMCCRGVDGAFGGVGEWSINDSAWFIYVSQYNGIQKQRDWSGQTECSSWKYFKTNWRLLL